MDNKIKKTDKNDFRQDLKKLAFYTSLPFMMAAIVGLGAFAGYQADKYLNTKYPYFTVGITALAVILAIYYAIKDLIKFKK